MKTKLKWFGLSWTTLALAGLLAVPASFASAQEEEVEETVSVVEEEAVDPVMATAEEAALAPTVAAIKALKAEDPESDAVGYAEGYLEMLEGQGVWAFAFDFFTTSMLWTVIAAALVFIMHLGFATLEAGLTQSKNTVNIMFKNVWIISVGILTYAAMGFNTHYPLGDWMINGVLSIKGPIGDLNAGGRDPVAGR